MKSNLLFSARLEECYNSLTKSEKKVADFIREHVDTVSEMSAQKIAELTGTGPATVVRFCRSCGYSGLLELKTGLKRETVILDRADDLEIQAEDSVSVVKQKILKYNSAVLDCVMNEWNETAIEQAVDAIGHAKQVVVSGSGDSRIGAVMLHNNLSLQNKNTYHTMDQVEEQNLLVRLQEQDVFVGFTYTGRYRYMAQNFKTAKQMGATTIGIMGIPWSETEKYVDIPLYTSSGNKKYYFGSNNSVLGDIIMVEILTTVLAIRYCDYSEHHEKMRDILEMHRLQKNEKI